MQQGAAPAGHRVGTDKRKWQRARTVIARVLDLSPDDRAAALDSECGSDAELRAYVDALLAEYERDSAVRSLLESTQITPPAGAFALPPRGGGPPTTPETSQRPDADGNRLWGDFLLLQELGRGGFGVVYRAWEQNLQREVALKLIDSSVYPERREIIRREGQMLARLNHPNVVKVHSTHQSGDVLAIAMEYVRGRTLASLVEANGPFPPRDAALISATLCGAVAAVHRRGLLHRDIKASNVMRATTGRIVLMDFGAGRELHGERQTRTQMIGTPLYMAPEILVGGHATPASDVYSLGVLLYFLLTGRYPEPPLASRADAGVDCEWVAQALPGVPAALAVIVARMLDAEPKRRPVLNGEFRQALARAVPRANRSAVPQRVEHVPPRTAVDVTPVPPPKPPDPHTSNLRAVIVAVAAGLAAVFVAGAISTMEFNAVLGRHGRFANESALAHVVVGAKSMLGPAIVAALALITVPMGAMVWQIAGGIAPRLMARVELTMADVTRHLARRQLLTRAVVDQVCCLLGIGGLVAVLSAYPEFVAALTTSAVDGSAEIFGVFHSGLREQKSNFRMLLSLVALLVVGLQLLSRRLPAGKVSGVASIAVIAIVVLIAAAVVGSWRVMYTKDAREVLYGAERCYVIGEHQRDWLLHCPGKMAPRNRVVASSEPQLQLTGHEGSPFDAYPLVPGYTPESPP